VKTALVDLGEIMTKTLRVILLSALLLSSVGWFIYHLGSRMNLAVENENQALWERAPGDVWLYVGGVMMLLSGALIGAAFLFWKGNRNEMKASYEYLGDDKRRD
jgi:hypothetical protein